VLQGSASAAPRSVPQPANSAAPQPTIDDYQHARWTTEDGAPPAIRSMAQTTDGWLWLGTLDGLYRFDGLRFTRYPLPARLVLNRNMIAYLHAGPHGELYIGHTAEGISVIQADGRLQSLPPIPGPARVIDTLTVDVDGSIWIVSNGIYHLRDGRWHTADDDAAWSARDVRGFMLDQRGQLWLSRDRSTWRLNRTSGHFERMLDVGGDLLPAPDGRLWLSSDEGELRPLADAGTEGGPPDGAPREAVSTAQFAPDSTLWALHCPDRPCFIANAARSGAAGYNIRKAPGAVVTEAVQMSGRNTRGILVDREGDIWISTESGLDRFRRKRFAGTGLTGAGSAYSLATDAEGRAWAAHTGTGQLWQLLPDGAVPVATMHPVTVLARDPSGALLMGGKRSILRKLRDGTQEVPLPPGPDGKPMDMRMAGVLDDGKVLWTATLETGLIGWREGQWHPHRDYRLPAKIYQSARAGTGQLWLATGDGELFLYDVEPNRSSPPIDIRALGMTSAIFPGTELVVSGENGSGVVRGGKLSMLRSTDPNALRNVSGLVVTADGDRWLNGAAGLVHVRADDWRRSVDDPALPLRHEIFDSLDGYPGRAVIESRWPSAWSADGRTLWLVATGGVVRFDTANLDRNRIPPTPVILSLTTDKAVYRTDAPASLAPGTERFRIDFTAPVLRKPERVRFEYLLEGVDTAWQDAGVRRTTYYTNLKPGAYLFRLRAINEDGERSTADATLPVTVEPTVAQTLWFKLLAATALALVLVFAYRYRVRYLTGRLAERLHVKTAERERIARTLHDTFLQTVQSLLLRVDAIAGSLPKDDGTRRQLESALEHASSALGEGREQLQELRSSGKEKLEDGLDDTIGPLQAVHPGITIGLRVEGEHRRVRPEVASEAASIAREALHNACIHAQADQVRALLCYAPDSLTLAVTDNGRGIDAEVMRNGAADGHWGLVGMRERANRIGAALEIGDGAEGGTVVRLSVPGPRAYAD
jgi:signal transduction histidine kinase/ligand-binding sensor domain-containing protein